MSHRVNSAIHLVSAGYWAFATLLGALIGPYPFKSLLQFRVWVLGGVVLILADLAAGITQWRSEDAGRVLSIVLHFGVALLVTSLMTFEYLQTGSKSFLNWFRNDNYWFIAGLAMVRLCIGSVVLLGNRARN